MIKRPVHIGERDGYKLSREPILNNFLIIELVDSLVRTVFYFRIYIKCGILYRCKFLLNYHIFLYLYSFIKEI